MTACDPRDLRDYPRANPGPNYWGHLAKKRGIWIESRFLLLLFLGSWRGHMYDTILCPRWMEEPGDQGLVTCVAAGEARMGVSSTSIKPDGLCWKQQSSQIASGRRRGCDKAGIPHAGHLQLIHLRTCMRTVLTLGSPGGIVDLEGKVLDGPPCSSTRPVSGAIGRSFGRSDDVVRERTVVS